MKFIVLILASAFAVVVNGFVYQIPKDEVKAACSLKVNSDLGSPQPLLINPGSTTFFRASDSIGTLSFDANQQVLLACPGTSNYLRIKGSGVREALASCVSGNTFSVDGVSYPFSSITCNTYPVEEDRSSGTCLSGKTLIKIGFTISTGFAEVYEACHDTALAHTIYTKFKLTTDAAGFQTGIDRPDWGSGNFFTGLNPTDLYRRATQRVTFTELLGSAALAEQYIDLVNDYFLSKGHLVAKSDFLYGSQQLATFYYMNAAPQWQTFNGANWNSLENDVKSFSARIGYDLDVYTGTYGLAQLNNVNGSPTNLYLTTSGRMPVPRMFWKVLYNPVTQAGIAFIGLNNPYQTAAEAAADVRCTNICSQITWLTWSPNDLKKGYSYCCEVNNFRTAFPDLPSFPVNSVLS